MPFVSVLAQVAEQLQQHIWQEDHEHLPLKLSVTFSCCLDEADQTQENSSSAIWLHISTFKASVGLKCSRNDMI